jgi:hypothetical protein
VHQVHHTSHGQAPLHYAGERHANQVGIVGWLSSMAGMLIVLSGTAGFSRAAK